MTEGIHQAIKCPARFHTQGIPLTSDPDELGEVCMGAYFDYRSTPGLAGNTITGYMSRENIAEMISSENAGTLKDLISSKREVFIHIFTDPSLEISLDDRMYGLSFSQEGQVYQTHNRPRASMGYSEPLDFMAFCMDSLTLGELKCDGLIE